MSPTTGIVFKEIISLQSFRTQSTLHWLHPEKLLYQKQKYIPLAKQKRRQYSCA